MKKSLPNGGRDTFEKDKVLVNVAAFSVGSGFSNHGPALNTMAQDLIACAVEVEEIRKKPGRYK